MLGTPHANGWLISTAWCFGLEGLLLLWCCGHAAFSALHRGGLLSALSDPVIHTWELLRGRNNIFCPSSGQAFSITCLPKCPLTVSDSDVCREMVGLQADLAEVLLNCSSLAHSPKVCNLALSFEIMLQTTESPTAWILTGFIQQWRSKKQSRG